MTFRERLRKAAREATACGQHVSPLYRGCDGACSWSDKCQHCTDIRAKWRGCTLWKEVNE